MVTVCHLDWSSGARDLDDCHNQHVYDPVVWRDVRLVSQSAFALSSLVAAGVDICRTKSAIYWILRNWYM